MIVAPFHAQWPENATAESLRKKAILDLTCTLGIVLVSAGQNYDPGHLAGAARALVDAGLVAGNGGAS